MVNIGITRMSSKGQIIIPANMREDFQLGDNILIIQDDKRIILKKIKQLTEKIQDDLEFAKRTEDAYERHRRGDFICKESNDFLKELEKW